MCKERLRNGEHHKRGIEGLFPGVTTRALAARNTPVGDGNWQERYD